jgi:hypothetical protein
MMNSEVQLFSSSGLKEWVNLSSESNMPEILPPTGGMITCFVQNKSNIKKERK